MFQHLQGSCCQLLFKLQLLSVPCCVAGKFQLCLQKGESKFGCCGIAASTKELQQELDGFGCQTEVLLARGNAEGGHDECKSMAIDKTLFKDSLEPGRAVMLNNLPDGMSDSFSETGWAGIGGRGGSHIDRNECWRLICGDILSSGWQRL